MGKIRLIALDMDGTLLNEENVISAENKFWIASARKAGVEVTLASGRHRSHLQTYVDELALSAPVVTLNGCEIWTPDGTLLDRTELGLDVFQELCSLGEEFDVAYSAYAVEGVFNEWELPAKIDACQWLMFLYRSEERGILDRIRARLADRGVFEISMSSPAKLDINPLGVSKASGLQFVCERLGIRPEEVMAIGDGLNDTAMIRWSGIGVAMDNAVDELKAVADRTTGHHRHNGVARAIETVLREQL